MEWSCGGDGNAGWEQEKCNLQQRREQPDIKNMQLHAVYYRQWSRCNLQQRHQQPDQKTRSSKLYFYSVFLEWWLYLQAVGIQQQSAIVTTGILGAQLTLSLSYKHSLLADLLTDEVTRPSYWQQDLYIHFLSLTQRKRCLQQIKSLPCQQALTKFVFVFRVQLIIIFQLMHQVLHRLQWEIVF